MADHQLLPAAAHLCCPSNCQQPRMTCSNNQNNRTPRQLQPGRACQAWGNYAHCLVTVLAVEFGKSNEHFCKIADADFFWLSLWVAAATRELPHLAD
jgi:hypothetical protein